MFSCVDGTPTNHTRSTHLGHLPLPLENQRFNTIGRTIMSLLFPRTNRNKYRASSLPYSLLFLSGDFFASPRFVRTLYVQLVLTVLITGISPLITVHLTP